MIFAYNDWYKADNAYSKVTKQLQTYTRKLQINTSNPIDTIKASIKRLQLLQTNKTETKLNNTVFTPIRYKTKINQSTTKALINTNKTTTTNYKSYLTDQLRKSKKSPTESKIHQRPISKQGKGYTNTQRQDSESTPMQEIENWGLIYIQKKIKSKPLILVWL